VNRARVAVSVMPLENRHDVLVALATAADRLGYDGFFLPETWAYDTTVLLAEVAVRTERLALGTGILGVWNRSAATIAMAAATLATSSGGRFVLGLGASTPQLAEGLHDTPFAAPVARMRRTVEQVRALLRGDRMPLAVTTGALVSPSVPAVVSDDPARAREGAAWFAAFYIVSMGTLYRQSLARQGFGKQVEAVLAANTPKFTGASSASGGRGGAARAAAATEPESRGAGVHAGRPAAARRRGVRSAPWSRAR
jgi:hypothetical protein